MWVTVLWSLYPSEELKGDIHCRTGVVFVTGVGLEFQTRQSSLKTRETEVTCDSLLQHWALNGLNTANLSLLRRGLWGR